MPIPSSNRSFESIPWNGCTINLSTMNSNEWSKIVEKQSRSIRHNTYNANLAQTSLSLKNLTQLNSNSNTKSYLLTHLEKQSKLSMKPRSKSQDPKPVIKTEEEVIEDETNDDDYYFNKNASITNMNQISEKDLDFLPRTAPLPGFSFNKKSRKNFENMTSFQLITSAKSMNQQIENLSANSGILSKRKKKSLRI